MALSNFSKAFISRFSELLELTHNLAHLGQNNTENLLATKIYFPGYTSKVKTLVLDCEVCKQVNIHTRKEPSGMTPTPSKCFEIVNCDFKGPFHDGQYVHVFLDNFQNGQKYISLNQNPLKQCANILHHSSPRMENQDY